MIIAIASQRGPKVEAVQQVLASISTLLKPEPEPIEYLTFDVDGGIAMPRSIAELMGGATSRVDRLRGLLAQQKQRVDFFVGMEGGFHMVNHGGKELVFLQSWACVSDGASRYYGSSGNIEVPDTIAHEVMNNGRELGEVIDTVASGKDIRSRQGTWGVLTNDLITRRESFESALMAAFAPFYNKAIYR